MIAISPDEWITELESIRAKLDKLNAKMSDLDFSLHLLSNIHDAYDTNVKILLKSLKMNTLNLEELKQDLMRKFSRINKCNEVEDIALT